jgi:predicted nucleotidyltransferase
MKIGVEQLRKQKATILDLAAKYGICSVQVFGSLARGDYRASSDVDLLVDFEPGRSLLDQVGFEQEMEALLGCHVDVVARGGISPHLEGRILEEAVVL